jgi:hypothetical protein
MTKQNSNRTVAAFFDRLLDQQASQVSAEDMDRRQAQIFCGRWLALRRLDLGLSLDCLAREAWISAQSILFVETGLADRNFEPDADWEQYGYLLSATPHDQGRVKRVLEIALGRVETPSEHVMIQVVADLNAAYIAQPLGAAPLAAAAALLSPRTLLLRWAHRRRVGIRRRSR